MDKQNERSGVPIAIGGILLFASGLFIGWLELMGSPHSEAPKMWFGYLATGMVVVGFAAIAFASIRGAVRSFRQ
jgi:hypothetical protein